ncbi:hypothetical protein PAXINDRAFT_22357 [Paxillus involutus ATCC 200175]|uniref:Uncharacterized protein n=1 Tax=Paxillus involutus ATCC 200175 TaxID=664439 RepID=A0A0C9SS88_PAXIN|nr:hypothetical protein PAXINDRAFT_22357 [Paxillus involutus ATCC 200175]
MGLSDERSHYNILCDIVRKLVIKYLDSSRTLSQQKDRLLVEKIIKKAQSQSEKFMEYEGGWVVCDMMAQFLRNWSAKERQMREDLELEARRAALKRKSEEITNASGSDEEELMSDNCMKPPSRKQRKTDAISQSSDESDDGHAETVIQS